MAILQTPRFSVVYATDPDAPDAEQVEVDVQAVQGDVIRYDLMRRRHGWPSVQDAPMLWTTVVAWAALLRLKHPVSTDFEVAAGQLLSVQTLTRDGDPAADDTDPDLIGVDPTPGRA